MELFFYEWVPILVISTQTHTRAEMQKSAFQMFYDEGNVVNTFVRAQGYTQCMLVSNTDCLWAKVRGLGLLNTFDFAFKVRVTSRHAGLILGLKENSTGNL